MAFLIPRVQICPCAAQTVISASRVAMTISRLSVSLCRPTVCLRSRQSNSGLASLLVEKSVPPARILAAQRWVRLIATANEMKKRLMERKTNFNCG